MGFTTVVVMHNDQLDRAPAEMQRAARCYSGRSASQRYRLETDFGWGHIASQAHADFPQITVTHCNLGQPLEECNDLGWMALDQLKRALERHGYRVTKRRKAAGS